MEIHNTHIYRYTTHIDTQHKHTHTHTYTYFVNNVLILRATICRMNQEKKKMLEGGN